MKVSYSNRPSLRSSKPIPNSTVSSSDSHPRRTGLLSIFYDITDKPWGFAVIIGISLVLSAIVTWFLTRSRMFK